MSTILTLFKATLVQDSALSVSGLDRSSTSDRPFTLIDGQPVLRGTGLKGAAVAMARRCFRPLPRSVSDDAARGTSLVRSAWEFRDAGPTAESVDTALRAGVGIRQKTGARAEGVLHDREVVPAGTEWEVEFRVDWTQAGAEAEEAEGILGYVLAEQWLKGKNHCWLGGDVARGLGWCHLEGLEAYRLDEAAYDAWLRLPTRLPAPEAEVPTVLPTKSWCFRTLEAKVSFGEYRPDGPETDSWGLDMLAIGPHDVDRGLQPKGDGGTWAKPPWAGKRMPDLPTDRAMVMEGKRPLLPGSSVRGPLRHELSRIKRMAKESVKDPHPVNGDVGPNDPVGKVFGTVNRSSQVLIQDARVTGAWSAARLHMHAEDEFSASTYGSSKRDAVRLLQGTFPVKIVVEGPDEESVRPNQDAIDELISLGMLGHLPIGGHKTRGAGWGHWTAGDWTTNEDVEKKRDWAPLPDKTEPKARPPKRVKPKDGKSIWERYRPEEASSVGLTVQNSVWDPAKFTLGACADEARRLAGGVPLVAWWCEPSIDFTVTSAPPVFGTSWPVEPLRVDEVAFFFENSAWRAARTAGGVRCVRMTEVEQSPTEDSDAKVVETPVRLHDDRTRFAAHATGKGKFVIREWIRGGASVGFTLRKEK